MFHVMNRSAKQLTLFDEPADYVTFLQVLAEAESACPIRLLEYLRDAESLALARVAGA